MALKGLSETPVTENMKLLKNSSRVAGLIVGAGLLLTSPITVQASEKSDFYWMLLKIMQTKPIREVDKQSLDVFLQMTEEQKTLFYDGAVSYCKNRRLGVSDSDLGTMVFDKADEIKSPIMKEIAINLVFISYQSALYTICPDMKR